MLLVFIQWMLTRSVRFWPALMLLLTALCIPRLAEAQGTATLRGMIVTETEQQPVDLASIYLDDFSANTESSENGRFELEVPADRSLTLVVSRIGFEEKRLPLKPLAAGQVRTIRVALRASDLGLDVIVREDKLDKGTMVREDAAQLRMLPSTTGNLESVLPAIALGVNSGTGGELSSQYNVRGGNYDENLVYVNDFEIYRPQLIRTGQQEGLTFANLDLANSLSFSSGGFEARYGDKMSSVLDVKYKRPDSLRGSVSGSLLGASGHLEGSVKLGDDYRRLRYLLGVRHKTTRYLLGSLDAKGEYLPRFLDLQSYVTYDLSKAWQLGMLLNYNSAHYSFEPNSRATGFGLLVLSLRLQSALAGQELDEFTTGMGGLSLTYVPERSRNPLYLKFLGSGFHIREIERASITGDYVLQQVESSLGSDNFGNPVRELASGTQQRYLRNYLYSNVGNFTHLGGIELQSARPDTRTQSNFIQWGLTLKREQLADRINEWERLDSQGYSLPLDADKLLLNYHYQSQNRLTGTRLAGFVQNTWTWRAEDRVETRLNVGLRGGYWSVNGEGYLAPRGQLLIKPLGGRRDLSYRVAGGVYVQPPFYRELRRPDGTLNLEVRAQKSIHALLGMTYDFNSRKKGRPYRFIGEVYYKKLYDLVSYEVDNVRIRYSGENDATGYVAGLDMRVNGEFIKGTESWINVSLLRAREQLNGVTHLKRVLNDSTTVGTVKTVPRPSDQFATVSLFFQDYLRRNKNVKLNLTATVGTGLPYGVAGDNRVYRNTYRYSSYRRVDAGFSVQLWQRAWKARRPNHPLRFTESAWVSLEVFNILGVRNEASKTWIKTVASQQLAVPNYLTGRRLNLRARVEF